MKCFILYFEQGEQYGYYRTHVPEHIWKKNIGENRDISIHEAKKIISNFDHYIVRFCVFIF